MPDNVITKIEERLDEDYKQCFPQSMGWEKAAAHLLVAYDYKVRGAYVRTIDRMKYALMHTLRWGHAASSHPFRGYPDDFDPKLFEKCLSALRRGTEYVGIWGAFNLYHNRVVDIERVEDNQVEFTANPSWKAYDVLDSQIAWTEQSSFHSSSLAAFQNLVTQLANGFEGLTPREMTDWFPDFGSCRDLLSPVGKLLREGAVLPQSWSFDGISILDLRAFWRAVLALAILHLGVVSRLIGQQYVGMVQILSKPRDAMVDWIAGCAGIGEETVERLIDLHTYDRSSNTPDIAITPFLPLGDGRLAASPYMLTSSSFERNFCAHAAREYAGLYAPSDRHLAEYQANELQDAFEKAGFQATRSVEFNTDDTQGDIDLLVWSPREHHIMAVELYWKIAAADVMEVFHGEKTCMEKMHRQLPKYEKVLSLGAADFVARAFNLKTSPAINGWSCGLGVRGFVGTPRIDTDRFFFIPDSLLLEEVSRNKSLEEICDWAKAKPFLPEEGRDFQMRLEKVTSPSGITVEFWE